MAATPSSMLALGTRAPEFSLADTEGTVISLSVLDTRKGILVVFLCNHCPYVIHIQKKLIELTRWAADNKIPVVGINSNDIERYPEDAPDKMKLLKKKLKLPFPYLFDKSQTVAKSYRAACTPDFFLFDGKLGLVYRGQFDDSRPGNSVLVTGKDLETAIQCLIEGSTVPTDQRPSLGCNIKWKPGNEPKY